MTSVDAYKCVPIGMGKYADSTRRVIQENIVGGSYRCCCPSTIDHQWYSSRLAGTMHLVLFTHHVVLEQAIWKTVRPERDLLVVVPGAA